MCGTKEMLLICKYIHKLMSLGIMPFSKIFLTVLFDTLTNNVSFLFLFLIKHLFECVALLCNGLVTIRVNILYQCINVHVYTLI
jgi:Ran GTPase-activating protein (RanGAP) involved in mRNA processing and transport